MVTRRQGRCLPYGEGVTFWALSEIVKEHAGIRDPDDAATVQSKLEAVLPEGGEGMWLRQRLRPLLGPCGAASRTRGELRRLDPLPRADRGLGPVGARPGGPALGRRGHALVRRAPRPAPASAVPLLVLACTSPRAVGGASVIFAAGRADSIRLQPGGTLPRRDGEPGRSAAGPARRPRRRRDRGAAAAAILSSPNSRARLVVDAGPDVTTLPGSVQAVIAARIDSLSRLSTKPWLPTRRSSAAVFWDGVLAEIAPDAILPRWRGRSPGPCGETVLPAGRSTPDRRS